MENLPLPTLQGDNLTLRKATLHDAESLFLLPTDPQIHEMFGGSADALSERTLEGAQAWARSLVDHPFAWLIEYGKIIGATRLDRVDMRDRRASFAIGIYWPDLLGTGLGTEATRLVLDFAFGQLKLHRVALRVIEHNQRAIRSYQKCGFKIEGRERDRFVNGRWHDDIMMGLLESEYV